MLIILLVVCIMALSSVHGADNDVWTVQKCGIDNQKLYNREWGYDTCADLCKGINPNPDLWYGRCELNGGYGFCKCIFTDNHLPPM